MIFCDRDDKNPLKLLYRYCNHEGKSEARLRGERIGIVIE